MPILIERCECYVCEYNLNPSTNKIAPCGKIMKNKFNHECHCTSCLTDCFDVYTTYCPDCNKQFCIDCGMLFDINADSTYEDNLCVEKILTHSCLNKAFDSTICPHPDCKKNVKKKTWKIVS
jgi:hypothetical protein